MCWICSMGRMVNLRLRSSPGAAGAAGRPTAPRGRADEMLYHASDAGGQCPQHFAVRRMGCRALAKGPAAVLQWPAAGRRAITDGAEPVAPARSPVPSCRVTARWSMILGLEIGMLVAGLIALITGKFK